MHRFLVVFCNSFAITAKDTKVVLRSGISLVCRFEIPLYCLLNVLSNSLAVFVNDTKVGVV